MAAATDFSVIPDLSIPGISSATFEDILHALRMASTSFSSFTEIVSLMLLVASATFTSASFLTYSTPEYGALFMLKPTLTHPLSRSLRMLLRSSRSAYSCISPMPSLAPSASRGLTMTSRFPSLATAMPPSNVPERCPVRYQNVESKKGSWPLIMTMASSSGAFSVSLFALEENMPPVSGWPYEYVSERYPNVLDQTPQRVGGRECGKVGCPRILRGRYVIGVAHGLAEHAPVP